MTQVAAVMVTLILLAAVRARDELDASSALAWPLLIGMFVLLLGSAMLWLRYEWRPRRREQLPTPTRLISGRGAAVRTRGTGETAHPGRGTWVGGSSTARR